MRLILLMLLVRLSHLQQRQHHDMLSQNIVTDEVKTKIIKTKYGRVQGFISRVGRDASTARFVQIFLGVPYASPPTGNYRSVEIIIPVILYQLSTLHSECQKFLFAPVAGKFNNV